MNTQMANVDGKSADRNRLTLSLASAVFPLPIYTGLVGFGAWNVWRERDALTWDFLTGFVAGIGTLLFALGVGIVLFIRVARGQGGQNPRAWKVAMIHIRAFFGMAFLLYLPAALVLSSFYTFQRVLDKTAEHNVPFGGFSVLVMIVLDLVILFALLAWGRSLIAGIRPAFATLTPDTTQAPAAS